MSRVLLAMSGGVDSSVAAWLLRQQGHDVIGVFMRHGQEVQFAPNKGCKAGDSAWNLLRKRGCCSAADAADARRVADMLGIPFYAVNFDAEFSRIIDYFVDEYTAGRTPNPCIVCNTWLKFGKLFELADGLGAAFVATGHYARLAAVEEPPPEGRSPRDTPLSGDSGAGCGEIGLYRGWDAAKDQSYVLFGIRRDLLRRLIFPLGERRKDEIRGIAGRLGLRVAEKRDSQEICFVPDRDHARFVRHQRGQTDTSGEIATTDGKVVGEHAGLEHFTIGQRKRLGIAFGEPRYVVRIEPDTRRVVIGTKGDLARTSLTARDTNWLAAEPTEPYRCGVQIRYRSGPVAAMAHVLPESRFLVEFAEPCYGIAPGQAAVCYDGDRLLCGGWIE